MIEDLKETAACGMIIHYSVDTTTDMVTYNDINGRGVKSNNCSGCSWRAICKPSTLPEMKHYFLLLDPMKDTHIKAGMLKSQLQASKQRAQYSEHIIRIVLMEYSTAATTTPPQNLKKPE